MTQPEKPILQPDAVEQVPLPSVCEVSRDAALRVFNPLLAELSNPTSVLYAVAADRASRMSGDSLLGISASLLPDPSRSRVRVARYIMQSGELPAGAPGVSPDQAVALWTAKSKKDIPKLRVPEGEGSRVMEIADAIQMRGGGPTVYSREEVARVPFTDKTVLRIDGSVKNAGRERLTTALAYAEAVGYRRPIIATVNPARELQQDEKEVVASFAPNAQNEQELLIDSAYDKGFEMDRNGYGSRYLRDGSTYVTMTHEETGLKLIILAPYRTPDKNGVFNAYKTLISHGAELPGLEGFEFNGTDMVAVTGTHYGAMSVMNNLRATFDLRAELGSYHVIGDNQPASRTTQAHLIEVGLTLDAASRVIDEHPALKAALLPEAA